MTVDLLVSPQNVAYFRLIYSKADQSNAISIMLKRVGFFFFSFRIDEIGTAIDLVTIIFWKMLLGLKMVCHYYVSF